jgi:hypothetical protein
MTGRSDFERKVKSRMFNVGNLLDMISNFTGIKRADDMFDTDENRRYSQSQGEIISFMDMDLSHLIRSHRKFVNESHHSDKTQYNKGWEDAMKHIARYTVQQTEDENE